MFLIPSMAIPSQNLSEPKEADGGDAFAQMFAQASGTEPTAELPGIPLAGEGGPSFMDALSLLATEGKDRSEEPKDADALSLAALMVSGTLAPIVSSDAGRVDFTPEKNNSETPSTNLADLWKLDAKAEPSAPGAPTVGGLEREFGVRVGKLEIFPEAGTDAGANVAKATAPVATKPSAEPAPNLATLAPVATKDPAKPVPMPAPTPEAARALAPNLANTAAPATLAAKNATRSAVPTETILNARAARSVVSTETILNAEAAPAQLATDAIAPNPAPLNAAKTGPTRFGDTAETVAGTDKKKTARKDFGDDLSAVFSGPTTGVASANAKAAPEAPAPSVPVESMQPKIQQLAGQGGGRITVSLHPPELGKVELEVLTRGRKVEVRLLSDSIEAKHALQNSLGDLKHSLAQNQFELTRTEVKWSGEGLASAGAGGDSRSFQSFQQDPRESSGRSGHGSRGEAVAVNTTATTADRGADASLDDRRLNIRI